MNIKSLRIGKDNFKVAFFQNKNLSTFAALLLVP